MRSRFAIIGRFGVAANFALFAALVASSAFPLLASAQSFRVPDDVALRQFGPGIPFHGEVLASISAK